MPRAAPAAGGRPTPAGRAEASQGFRRVGRGALTRPGADDARCLWQVIGTRGSWIEREALVPYSPDLPSEGPVAARDIDKIIKGARPADPPVEEISTIVIGVNLKRARGLGHDAAVGAIAGESGDRVAHGRGGGSTLMRCPWSANAPSTGSGAKWRDGSASGRHGAIGIPAIARGAVRWPRRRESPRSSR